jgi:hypothetical protein
VQATVSESVQPAEESFRPEGQPAPLSPSRYLETVRRMLIVIALYAIPSVLVMQPVKDFDIWWHLRTGQWIVEHGAVPTTDPFSEFGLGKPWAAYSWLFEVLVYDLHQWFGLHGIILYRAVMGLLVAVTIHWFVVKREPRFLVATGLAGLAVLATARLLTERPWLFTVIFFALTLDAVLDLRAGRSKKYVWLLPLVYVLWASIHIQFIYGLFLLGLACVAPFLDRLLGRGRLGEHANTFGSRQWWELVALTSLCAAATLLNPYHLGLYGVIADYATQPIAFKLVSEHRAMEFRGPVDWAVLALAGSAAFALGRRRFLSAFEFLLLASSSYFAFHTQRDVWFLVFTAIAILTSEGCFPGMFTERFPLTRSRLAIVAGAVALVLAATAWARGLSASHLATIVEQTFPAKAASFVEDNHLAGPLFNHFDWGGYLIWRLPKLPVAIDGRTNLHTDARMLRSYKTWAGERGWDSDPELEAAGLVITSGESPLASLLRLDGGYKLIHEDPVAAVFIPQRSR